MKILLLLSVAFTHFVDGAVNSCTHVMYNSSQYRQICQRNKECYDGFMVSSATITCTDVSFEHGRPTYQMNKYSFYDQDAADYILNDYPISLKITNSTISILPAGAFKDFSALNILFLNSLNIQQLDLDAFKFQSYVQEIHLDDNYLSTIPDTIFNSVPQLTFLNLSNNNIEIIPDDVFKSTRLSFLFLSKNKIKQFFNADMLSSLTNLLTLDLSFNQLTSVEFSKQTFSLQVLLLNNNNIQQISLPENCKNLDRVDLSFNEIDDLTKIEKNDHVKIMDVSHNNLTQLNGNVFGQKLSILNASNNMITVIEPDTFKGLNELYILLLNNNNLTNISNLVFEDTEKLNVLDLSVNKLSKFSFGTFDNLRNLVYLNISYNEFVQLPLFTFHSLHNLQELYFQGNRIEDINVGDLQKRLPQLKKLTLHGNAWHCKRLSDILHGLKEDKIEFERGESVNNSHVFGIECTDTENESRDQERGDVNLDERFYNSAIYKYFNEGFEDSNFFQYLEGLNKRYEELKNQESLERNSFANFSRDLNSSFDFFLKEQPKIVESYSHSQFDKFINSTFTNATKLKLDVISQLSFKITVIEVSILIVAIIFSVGLLGLIAFIFVQMKDKHSNSTSQEFRPLLSGVSSEML